MQREQLLAKITQSFIANEVASYFNNELVATPIYKQDMKFAINKLKPILIKNGCKEFDYLFSKNEEISTELFDVLQKLILKISSFEMHRFGEVLQILEIYDEEFKKQNNENK